MKRITLKPGELQEITGLCLKRGIMNDIDLSQDMIQEFDKQYSDDLSPTWRTTWLIGCILREGYILGQRAERARAK